MFPRSSKGNWLFVRNSTSILLAAGLLLCVPVSRCAAELQLAAVFKDHLVLQRDKPVSLWGTALAGELVTVEFADQKRTVSADVRGKWLVTLDPLKASFESRSLKVNNIVLRDVLVGDVWLCSGQSNMNMTMAPFPPWHSGALNYPEEIAQAKHPNLRAWILKRSSPSEVPRDEMVGEWLVCSPETAGKMSAVAYYFARRLQDKINIPVGLIINTRGGVSTQAFLDRGTLAKNDAFRIRYLEPFDKLLAAKDPQAFHVTQPTLEYNVAVHPLLNLKFKGIIWYQGESNGGDGLEYAALGRLLIETLREKFSQGSLPFYFVQVAPWGWKSNDETTFTRDNYAHFREAQEKLLEIEQTGMAVTMDVGDPLQIHYPNKRPVGERLAALALAKTYGYDVTCEGPRFQNHMILGNKVTVSFDEPSVGRGLTTNDGKSPRHFFVCGPDQRFYPASAIITSKNQIELFASAVSNPVSVRYAFSTGLVTNLENEEGFPALPFRTDTYPEGQTYVTKEPDQAVEEPPAINALKD